MHCFIIFLRFFLCRLFLKSLLNLLQCCFCFMFFLWPWGMWDSSSPAQHWTHTLCTGRLSLNYWATGAVLTGSCFYLEQPQGFPGGSVGSAWNARDVGSIPGSGRSPGEGNGYSLQYSCLENSMDRGAWRATVHGVAKNQTWLSY